MDQDLELIDLGDAKEVTQGPWFDLPREDHPVMIYREFPPE